MKSEMQQHEIWYEINLFLVEVNNLQICLEQMQRALHAKYVEFLSYGLRPAYSYFALQTHHAARGVV